MYICPTHDHSDICIKYCLNLKGEIVTNTVILGEFNTPLSSKYGSNRQKISKDTSALKHTIK